MQSSAASSALISKLNLALESIQAARDGFGPQHAALIGISGGRDSVALLRGLVSRGWKDVIVCHMNHGLRGDESDADAAFVTQLAKELGVKCEITKADVARAVKRKRISVELAGRQARDAFFERMAAKHRTPFVFLAHHADDQAETVLGNLFRGTGLAGLSGMKIIATSGHLIKLRPLLHVRRSEVDEFFRSGGFAFREDSTNATPDHRRNRLRGEVLPLLNEVFDRDVTPILLRVSENARRDESCLEELARAFARTDALFQHDGSLRLTPELIAAHPAIQSRILLGLLIDVAQCNSIGSRDLDSALSMMQPGGPAKINLPGGRHLRRKARRLWVE